MGCLLRLHSTSILTGGRTRRTTGPCATNYWADTEISGSALLMGASLSPAPARSRCFTRRRHPASTRSLPVSGGRTNRPGCGGTVSPIEVCSHEFYLGTFTNLRDPASHRAAYL